jgi:hypothetical protein
VKDKNQRGALHLAVAGERLIVPMQEDGDILLVHRLTGATTTLVAGDTDTVNGIVSDDTYVYWTEGPDLSPKSVRRCALSGCPANGPEVLVASFDAFFPKLLLVSGRLYFAKHEDVDGGSFDAIDSVATDGTQRTTIVSRRPRSQLYAVAADATHIYWGENDGLHRGPISGVTTPQKVGGSAEITAVAVDATKVVWAETSVIHWLPLSAIGSSQQPALVASGQETVRAIALHGGYVYWAATGGSRPFISAVRRCLLPACTTVETIAAGLEQTRALVVDDLALYYSEAGNAWPAVGATIWRWVP